MATSEKLVLTAHDLADVLGICLPKAYDLMRSKGFPAVQLTPRRRVVPRAALDEWLMRQVDQNADHHYNKKAAFGVSAPKTAGGNIQFSAVLFPPSILPFWRILFNGFICFIRSWP